MNSDAAQQSFERGLLEFETFLLRSDASALRRAIDAFRAATTHSADDASYRTALGFALDVAYAADAALTELREAQRLDPENREVEILILTLLAEAGAEAEALAGIEIAARRQQVDLDALRKELRAADMPVDARTIIMNGFIGARNFLRSWLEDEIERVTRPVGTGRDACKEMQQEHASSVDPARVPAAFRGFTPWAGRLGIGDDVCRGILFADIAEDQRHALRRAIEPHAAKIHAWLDSFGSGELSPEAAAFMYLLLGIEEHVQAERED